MREREREREEEILKRQRPQSAMAKQSSRNLPAHITIREEKILKRQTTIILIYAQLRAHTHKCIDLTYLNLGMWEERSNNIQYSKNTLWL